MSGSLKEKVAWFLKHLDWQLEDLQIEKENLPIDTYFDTADVLKIVLGMQGFYTVEGGFKIESFGRERTLVHCLAASGWLGTIKMLSPHQAEFLTLLNMDFGVGLERDLKGLAWRFLEAVKVVGHSMSKAMPLDNMSDESLLKFVKNRAVSAINLFKAVQCIRGNWQTRLVKLRQSGLLQLDTEKVDYTTIVNREEFEKLKQAFDLKRPERKVNNYADAVAVTILIMRLEKLEELKRVPRFFVSTGLFREAVEDAGIADSLCFTINSDDSKDERPSVLREADYFLFKSMFRPPPELLSPADKHTLYFTEYRDLQKLRDQVAVILTAQDSLTPNEVDKIQVKGRPLSTVIEELEKLSFLENVWLPFSGEKDVQLALRDLGEAAEQLKSREFQRVVDKAVKVTKEELAKNVEGYKKIKSLMSQLEQSVRKWRDNIPDLNQVPDVFWDLGLLRFGFPKSSHQRIHNIFEGLLGDNESQVSARKSVIMAFHSGNKSTAKHIDELATAAAVLWVVERMDAELIELLENIDPLPHYSLKIIYAAAIFRLKRNMDKGKRMLRQLQGEYDKAVNPQDKANLAVGIAYLFFHLWKASGHKASWRPSFGYQKKAANDNSQALINNAIKYANKAKDACSASKTKDHQKRVYAINQYLYYMVEGGEDNCKSTMIRTATELLEHKEEDNRIWQYRFDDTLARHYHRLARSSPGQREWLEYINAALRLSNAALIDSHGDREVDRYLDVLKMEKDAGFQARS
jgi:DNA-binding transcriptional regulator GbsR (MarR family)